MTLSLVESIEAQVGRPLPEGYRAFLLSRRTSHLTPAWLVRTEELIPGGGPEEHLRCLATAEEMLEDGLIGEQAEGMLVVGRISMGGYLYLSVGMNRPGAFFARFPFEDPKFYLVAFDFDDLLDRSRPDPDE